MAENEAGNAAGVLVWQIERNHDGVIFGISEPATAKHDLDFVCNFDYMEHSQDFIEPRAHLLRAAPDLLAALTGGNSLDLPGMVEWVADRFVNVHDGNPNVDYVLALRRRAEICRAAINKAKGIR